MTSSIYNQVIALTGSIGSGKSSVAQILKKFGASVISADFLAKAALEKDTTAYHQVIKEFGHSILNDKGEINRQALAAIIFNDQEKRKKLEAIIHPQVQLLAQNEFNKAIKSAATLIIYECPLFFEAGLDKLGFKKVINVSAPENILISRIKERNKISEEEAKKRLKSQLSTEIKNSRADYIIDNSGTLEELEEKTKELYQKLVS